MKTKNTVARAAGNTGGSGRRAGSNKRKDAAFGAEHTKPSDSRSVIRATEGKRWTARQQGRG